ncbi:MAG TPA: helix-turn-helix domain-containing protein [Pyrinomonadaceae bacterium]|nr:helix-turn-helix domain-containing protein [Pyrinomonadaceae bacterium]
MNSQTSSPRSLDQRTLKTQQTMRENLHRDLTLSELAKSVNLSVWRLSHVFRSDLGMSPIKYLKLLRLEKAKYLLESSFLSVKEITYRVGINDESHFVRDFKKAYGNAPSQHRTLMNELPKASQLDQPVKIKYGAKKSLAILLPTLNLISYTASVAASSVV